MSPTNIQPLPASPDLNPHLNPQLRVVPDDQTGLIPGDWTRFLLRASEIVECDLLFFNTPDGESGNFRTTRIKGPPPGPVGPGNSTSIGAGQTSAVLTTRRTLVRDYLASGAGLDGEAELIGWGIRSTLTALIGSGDRIYGVLGLGSNREAAFGEVQQAAVEALAAVFGSLIEAPFGDEATPTSNDSLVSRIAELEQERSELEDLANLTAHYIKEPMGSIIGFGKLLDRPHEGRIDANADRWVSRMVAASFRMKALVDRLSEYSRLVFGPVGRQPIDCQAIVAGQIQQMEQAINESGGRIACGALPGIVSDPILFAEIFSRLLDNAIKFRGGKPPRVLVSGRLTEGESVFSVQDNGIGLDVEHSELIFEPFKRLHTTDEYPGFGLGLAACAKAVSRLGGRIWVESRLGEGATFSFTMPLRQVDPETID